MAGIDDDGLCSCVLLAGINGDSQSSRVRTAGCPGNSGTESEILTPKGLHAHVPQVSIGNDGLRGQVSWAGVNDGLRS